MAKTCYLVTGTAGFIGYHTAKRLLEQGHEVVGADNVNDYYAPQLKRDRLAQLNERPGFTFYECDLADRPACDRIFDNHKCQTVIHLAAQAGVRYSLENPDAYIQSNLTAFGNILECCRHHQAEHLAYASSSSVYGANKVIPFSEHHSVDHPVSLYAATKKANELLAHTYSHLYRLPTTGLRFFTVYGPWGRPDMAYFLFTKAILAGDTIKVFNHGKMRRDFTYVDDIVEGVIRTANKPATPDSNWQPEAPNPQTSNAPFRVFNIGNNQPVELLEMIQILERQLGRQATKQMMPMQPGDVVETYADTQALEDWIGFKPSTSLASGIEQFAHWYTDYYKVS